jgi:uncharacterized protein YaiL (DUF2058 family)
MSMSLKDQLIAAGLLKPQSATTPAPANSVKQGKPKPEAARRHDVAKLANKASTKREQTSEELSLATAWKVRAQQESAEQAALKRAAEEKARAKRERQNFVQALIEGKAQNDANAEQVRHFQYGKKVARVYVTAEQSLALSESRLGVAQWRGRYVLLEAEIMQALLQRAPEFVALFGTHGQSVEVSAELDQAYTDEKYKVPDDLRW